MGQGERKEEKEDGGKGSMGKIFKLFCRLNISGKVGGIS